MRIVFLWTLSYLTIQKTKQVVAAAQVCSEGSAVARVAPSSKVAPLYVSEIELSVINKATPQTGSDPGEELCKTVPYLVCYLI